MTNSLAHFNKVMSQQTVIALATSVDHQANVRIVNFYYDESDSVLYFSSFKDNLKNSEIEKNNRIAFTTIPSDGNSHIRVKEAIALKSRKTIHDLAEEFCSKEPSFKEIIDHGGDDLFVYEVRFKQAVLITDFVNPPIILNF